jgi:hypothetical protein
MPRRTYYLKTLRLVTPAIAHRLGIKAEAPVFLSPFITGFRGCNACRRTYTPLVYQTGLVTEAQHFHEDCGGIYFYATTSLTAVASHMEQGGFFASLEPLGKTYINRKRGAGRWGRAEAVRTTAISVYCQHRTTCTRGAINYWCITYELTSGLLVEHPFPISAYCNLSRGCNKGNLLALCCGEGLPERVRAPFRFTVRDGEVFYTQLPLL